jgi:hypothetical protein
MPREDPFPGVHVREISAAFDQQQPYAHEFFREADCVVEPLGLRKYVKNTSEPGWQITP